MGEGAGVVCDVFALVFGADQSWCPVPYRSRREEGREARYTDTSQGRVNLEKGNLHLLGYLGRQLKLAGMRSVGTPPSSSEPIGRASSPMDGRPARLGDEVLRCIRESGEGQVQTKEK